MKITKEKLKELIKEVIKEQQEVDLSNHPNRSVASYFKVMLRQPPSRHQNLADLYDIMISDPESAANRAEEMGFTSGLVKFHQRGLKDVTGLPTGDDLFAAAQAAAQARKDAEEKARAEREANPPPPKDMADLVYPRDSRGKIIGRAD